MGVGLARRARVERKRRTLKRRQPIKAWQATPEHAPDNSRPTLPKDYPTTISSPLWPPGHLRAHASSAVFSQAFQMPFCDLALDSDLDATLETRRISGDF